MKKSKDSITKRIRCYYWKRRDKGKGKQTILFFCFLSIAMIFVVVSLCSYLVSIKMDHSEVAKVVTAENTTLPENKMDLEESEMLEENEKIDDVEVLEESPIEEDEEETSKKSMIDLSGLDSFLAYMTDESYENFQIEVEKLCVKRSATSVKKLMYQKVSDTKPVVTSYICLSDKSVYETVYNLKSNVFTIEKSKLTEVQLEKKQKASEKKEAAALLQQERKQKKTKKNVKKKEGKNR